MERVPVSSSNIISVGYDSTEGILEVEFPSGLYQYFSVPSAIYQGLMAASSHGSYFSQAVKGRYAFSKLR
ncbi:KTSC domain-containing protein [Streptomyces fildesensis]|uniref:KTSC domain-containing protein n=1 Tax=Streptomyces fildesensis TaxID=375757 RepID=A0ABW8CHZ0_9ACTN